jgi:hypothetical protein
MFRHFVGAGWSTLDPLPPLSRLAIFSKGGGWRDGNRWKPLGNDPALAIVRWPRNRNQGLQLMPAVRERVNVLEERAKFPTMDGMSMITSVTPGNGVR